MSTLYYFGCWNQAGHYLHAPGGEWVDKAGPFDYHIDGCFPPKREDVTIAALIHTKGWTILAMWDRSVDSRPGSNANFLMEGTHDTAAMWALARQHYPQIVARLKSAPA